MSDKILDIFRKYDRNGDGVITRDELSVVLKSLGHFQDSEISLVFSHIDRNSDGSVDAQEFVAWLQSGSKSPEDARAIAAMGPGSNDGLEMCFYNFCGPGKTDMDGKSFLKMCKDCALLNKRLTATEADLVFTKVVPKGARRMGFKQFEGTALRLLSEKAGHSEDFIREALMDNRPTLNNVTQAGSVPAAAAGTTLARRPSRGSTVAGRQSRNLEPGEIIRLTPGRSSRNLEPGDIIRNPAPGTTPSGTPTRATQRTGSRTGSRGASITSTAPNELEGAAVAAAAPAAAVSEEEPTMETEQQLFSGTWEDAFDKCAGSRPGIDSKMFYKICKECGLVDQKLSVGEVDLIFGKLVTRGKRHIGKSQFSEACWQISEKRGVDYGSVMDAIARWGGPGYEARSSRSHVARREQAQNATE